MNEQSVKRIFNAIISSSVGTTRREQDETYDILMSNVKEDILDRETIANLLNHAEKSINDFNDIAVRSIDEKEINDALFVKQYWCGKRDTLKQILKIQ